MSVHLFVQKRLMRSLMESDRNDKVVKVISVKIQSGGQENWKKKIMGTKTQMILRNYSKCICIKTTWEK